MRILSIVIPTFNEAGNISVLINRLKELLSALDLEIIVVDDNSPDGTSAIVKDLANKDCNIRCIERFGKRGLSSAVIEGIKESEGDYVVIMDADLQHDERIIPEMLQICRENNLDLVVGSRYQDGGGIGQFSKLRSKISSFATLLAGKTTRLNVKDPLSGFFLVKKSFLLPFLNRLSGKGFKILLDILLTSDTPPKISEVPFIFGKRNSGKSKLNPVVALEYLVLLTEKRYLVSLPLDFVSYMLVGLFGVFIHIFMLCLMHWGLNFAFALSQSVATLCAIGSNFFFNNKFTFFQNSREGTSVFTALFFFYILCLLGLFINLSISTNLFSHGFPWYVSGAIGMLISAVWNYMSSKLVVWR